MKRVKISVVIGRNRQRDSDEARGGRQAARRAGGLAGQRSFGYFCLFWRRALHDGGRSMTKDTCGSISESTFKQLDLLDSSLKMSRDTSRLDSPQSLATWKKMVMEQRGEYSQRMKLTHHTGGKESLSWATPTAHIAKEGGYPAEWTRNTPTLTAQATASENKPHSSGKLNPTWVEWLMGLPTNWTDLGSWGTE